MEQRGHSPRLVMAVEEALRQGRCRRLEAHLRPAAARRSSNFVSRVGHTKKHVDVTVTWVGEEGKPVFLTAVGLFTVRVWRGSGVTARLEVVRMEGLEEVVEVASMRVNLLGSSEVVAVQEIALPRHVALQPGARSADLLSTP